jgi:hypothetical protein
MIIRSIVALTLFLGGCATGKQTTPTQATRMAPTPYTAEQIREANPRGTRLVFRLEQTGEPTVLNVMVFVDSDAQAAVTESRVLSLSGDPIGDVGRSESTWVAFRDHGAFPADRTRRVRATVTVPAGTFDVWRYTVQPGTGQGEAVTDFWFALDRPGPPVLMETRTGSEMTLRMVLIEDSRGE